MKRKNVQLMLPVITVLHGFIHPLPILTSAATLLLRPAAVVEINGPGRRRAAPLRHEAVLHLRRDGRKAAVHVLVLLGGRLEKLHGRVKLVRQRLPLLGLHLAVALHVALVTHQNLVHVHVGVLVDLRYPVADGVERAAVGDVVDQEDALRAAEVRGGDGAEALLARRVPDLQLDALAVQLDRLDLEVDADGGDEGGLEGVVGVAQEQAALADACAAGGRCGGGGRRRRQAAREKGGEV